jgi:ABC-2 type transport system permease protein
VIRVELEKAARRWRTWLLAAALAGVPCLIALAVKLSPPSPADVGDDAPPFLLQIVRNGLFVPLTGIAVVQPFFLSLAVGLFAGDAIAGEAQGGTLRSLLVRPVERPRLIGAKYASALVLLGAMLLAVILAGLIAGGVLFGFDPLPTLSGSTLSIPATILRIGGAAVYILFAAFGITAIGLFVSTLTDSGPGAIIATVVLVIASQVLDQIPSLHAIHPFLPTHGWLGYADLFRFPVEWGTIRAGLVVSAVYAVVFLGSALAWFGRKDVTA